jgi:hypothetical protein
MLRNCAYCKKELPENCAKSAYTDEELIDMCKRIVEKA